MVRDYTTKFKCRICLAIHTAELDAQKCCKPRSVYVCHHCGRDFDQEWKAREHVITCRVFNDHEPLCQ